MSLRKALSLKNPETLIMDIGDELHEFSRSYMRASSFERGYNEYKGEVGTPLELIIETLAVYYKQDYPVKEANKNYPLDLGILRTRNYKSIKPNIPDDMLVGDAKILELAWKMQIPRLDFCCTFWRMLESEMNANSRIRDLQPVHVDIKNQLLVLVFAELEEPPTDKPWNVPSTPEMTELIKGCVSSHVPSEVIDQAWDRHKHKFFESDEYKGLVAAIDNMLSKKD